MLSERSPKKLCVGASAGGHTNELMGLLVHSKTWPLQPDVCVTTLEILRTRYEHLGTTYVIGECDRKRPFSAFIVLWRSFQFVRHERPEILVTTGSLPLAFVATFVKLFGGKVVWIDSIAQLHGLSLSGRYMRLFADLVLTQWPSIADNDTRVEFAGQLL